LLISADFIASDYCYDIEMARAIERHDAGEAVVIPIMLRACVITGTPFGTIQGLPKDFLPVVQWADRDVAWKNVAEGIEKALPES
jgi:internalin A